MRSFWKDYQGHDENLWKHEWNKHGTCISTLETKCFRNYTQQQDVLAYFEKTVELFKSLDSYKVYN
jgi:ribonuclease T2